MLDQTLLGSVQRFRSYVPSEADKARVGPPVSGQEDPRYEFQRLEMAFWRPASTRVQERMFALDEEAATVSQAPGVSVLKGYVGSHEVVVHVESQGHEAFIRWFSYPHASLRHTMPLWVPSVTGTYSYLGSNFGSTMTVSAADYELAPCRGILAGIYADDQDTDMKPVRLEPTAAE
jgi:hypothetical protein